MDKLAVFGGTPVREMPIYYGHQYIDKADIDAVIEVLKSDFLTCGPEISKLEQKLCKITGAKYAVVVSNGTAALHAACFASGIEPGDEVITTPLTFAASSNCVLYCGGRTVFADINSETYNISPDEIEKNITERTRAVIAVDFTGQAAELEKILEICRKYNLIFIEDAAHSIGTLYQGECVGNIADMTTFSFHPVKMVTGGEGGAILTNSVSYYEKLVRFRAHGITRNEAYMQGASEGAWYYQQVELGYNYRMTDMQAALINSQLDKLPVFKKRRREITEAYDKAFSKLPEIILQKEISQSDTARHLYIIQLVLENLAATRQEVFEALKAENVYCNVHYIPVYYFPWYKKLGYQKRICPKAEYLYERIITLPLFYSMTNADVDSVICAVQKVIGYYKV